MNMAENETTTEKHEEKILFLGKYSYDVQVNDPGLKDVISLKPAIIPKSAGLLSQQYLGRTKVNLVERLITHLMVPGHKGKKHWRTSKLMSGRFYSALNVVDDAFERISKSGRNPIEVLVRAVENSAPREEIMTLLIAGQRIPRQVDVSPIRRVDLALRWIAEGTFQSSFSGKKAGIALAEILTSAADNSPSSFPIAKKLDIEKQASTNR